MIVKKINMKPRLVLTAFLFIVLQLAVLLPSFGTVKNPVNEQIIKQACAQNIIDGNSCQLSLSACSSLGSDYINIIDGLNSGSITLSGTEASNKTEVITRLRNALGDDYTKACIDKNYDSLIQVFNGPGVRDPSYELNFCNPGDIAGQAPVADGFKVVGCCPSGYQLVASNVQDALASGAFYQSTARCCEVPSGTRYGGDLYPWESLNGRCIDKERRTVDGIDIISDSNRINGKSTGIESANSSNVIQVDNTDQSSPEICGAGIGCAVVDTNKGSQNISLQDSQVLEDTDGNQSNYRVVSPDTLETTSGLSCSSCIPVGGAIAIQGDSLLVCNGNGETSKQELINGNVNDTLAYLAAEGDPANQEALKTCRERGGIYIALGCIDPTPVGVITGLIRIGFGVIGGVALIQMILAGIAYQSGEEAKIEEARSKLFATIGGVLVLVFSVLILRIIGVNILDVIPGGAI